MTHNKTMRVLMYYSNRDVRLKEMAVPTIGLGELLMRVMASGICGSDVMEWYRRDKVPLVLGHEVAGVVVQVGEGVGKFKVGDRVAATHHVPCNTCHYCLNGHHTVCEKLLRGTHFDPGGFAEYIRVPAINVDRGVFHIPEGVSHEDASFMEYHSRRLVEMATDLFQAYLLTRDAQHSERKRKVAEIFVDKMIPRVDMNMHFIVEGEASLLKHYRDVIG